MRACLSLLATSGELGLTARLQAFTVPNCTTAPLTDRSCAVQVVDAINSSASDASNPTVGVNTCFAGNGCGSCDILCSGTTKPPASDSVLLNYVHPACRGSWRC